MLFLFLDIALLTHPHFPPHPPLSSSHTPSLSTPPPTLILPPTFQVLLDLARIIFEEQSTIEQMVYRIMIHMQSLLQCCRVQVGWVLQSAGGWVLQSPLQSAAAALTCLKSTLIYCF